MKEEIEKTSNIVAALLTTIFMVIIYSLLYLLIGFFLFLCEKDLNLERFGLIYSVVTAIVYIYSYNYKSVSTDDKY